MKAQKVLILRVALIASWLLYIGGVTLSFSLVNTLPNELQDWIAREIERPFATSEIILLGIGVPLLLGLIVGTIGLICLKKWAAWLYLMTLVAGYAIYPLSGPRVYHPVEEMMYSLSTFLSGLTVALAFFTNVLDSAVTGPNPRMRLRNVR